MMWQKNKTKNMNKLERLVIELMENAGFRLTGSRAFGSNSGDLDFYCEDTNLYALDLINSEGYEDLVGTDYSNAFGFLKAMRCNMFGLQVDIQVLTKDGARVKFAAQKNLKEIGKKYNIVHFSRDAWTVAMHQAAKELGLL